MKEHFIVEGSRNESVEETPMQKFEPQEIDVAIKHSYGKYGTTVDKKLLTEIALTALENRRSGIELAPSRTYALKMHLQQYPQESFGAYASALIKLLSTRQARIDKEIKKEKEAEKAREEQPMKTEDSTNTQEQPQTPDMFGETS